MPVKNSRSGDGEPLSGSDFSPKWGPLLPVAKSGNRNRMKLRQMLLLHAETKVPALLVLGRMLQGGMSQVNGNEGLPPFSSSVKESVNMIRLRIISPSKGCMRAAKL